MVYKHAYLNILLLLYFAFMLCMVKLPLKGVVGGQKGWLEAKRGGWRLCIKYSHGNYIVDHGKIMERSWNCVFEFLWEPCIIMGIVQCISVILAVFIKNTIFTNLRRKSTIFDHFF